MYYVIHENGKETGYKSESFEAAKSVADQCKAATDRKENFHVEARSRVYTTTTLEEAIKGTPFDPAYVPPPNGAVVNRAERLGLEPPRTYAASIEPRWMDCPGKG